MRSQQCNRLKERQRFHFDLLQNQLIAVGCRANSVSKAAGMVPSTGGCPLARVNGSGVGERNCGECRKNKIKNFSAWISQSNAGSKNRGQYHNDILIWRAGDGAYACNPLCAARIMSHFSPESQTKVTIWPFRSSELPRRTRLISVHADTVYKSDRKPHARSEQKNESDAALSWRHTKPICNLGRARRVRSIFQTCLPLGSKIKAGDRLSLFFKFILVFPGILFPSRKSSLAQSMTN